MDVQPDHLTRAIWHTHSIIKDLEEYEKLTKPSFGLTLAQHDAQNLLDKLRNLKQHTEERQ